MLAMKDALDIIPCFVDSSPTEDFDFDTELESKYNLLLKDAKPHEERIRLTLEKQKEKMDYSFVFNMSIIKLLLALKREETELIISIPVPDDSSVWKETGGGRAWDQFLILLTKKGYPYRTDKSGGIIVDNSVRLIATTVFKVTIKLR